MKVCVCVLIKSNVQVKTDFKRFTSAFQGHSFHTHVLLNAASWLFVYEEEEMADSSVTCTEVTSRTVGFRKGLFSSLPPCVCVFFILV